MDEKTHNDLEDLAVDLIKNGDVEDKLRFWWCNHYKRPLLDPLFDKYTLDQLLLEFYIVKYISNPGKLDEKDKIDAAKKKGKFLSEEEWLQKEMGEDYTIEEATIEEPSKEGSKPTVKEPELHDEGEIDITF